MAAIKLLDVKENTTTDDDIAKLARMVGILLLESNYT